MRWFTESGTDIFASILLFEELLSEYNDADAAQIRADFATWVETRATADDVTLLLQSHVPRVVALFDQTLTSDVIRAIVRRSTPKYFWLLVGAVRHDALRTLVGFGQFYTLSRTQLGQLIQLAGSTNAATVLEYLLSKSSVRNMADALHEALMLAAENGAVTATRLLLGAILAQPTYTESSTINAFDAALEHGQVDVARTLLELVKYSIEDYYFVYIKAITCISRETGTSVAACLEIGHAARQRLPASFVASKHDELVQYALVIIRKRATSALELFPEQVLLRGAVIQALRVHYGNRLHVIDHVLPDGVQRALHLARTGVLHV